MASTSWHRPAWALALLLGLLALIAGLSGAAGSPSVATAQGGEGRYSVLVFSRTTGFRHTAAINAGHDAFDQLATAADFDVTHSEDAGEFTSHSLRDYDVVAFLNTDGEGILNAQQRTAFERWTQNGGGAVRIHADANADKAWEWKEDMMGGGLFNNHPPIQEATVEVVDATHPATAELPATFQWSDEWYNFDADPREDVHVLMTVDESTYEGGEHGAGHPIAWCSEYDGGRNFYTAIGHADGGATLAWSNDDYLAHISGALEWAAGEEPGDCGAPRAGIPTEASLDKVTLDDGPGDLGGDDTGPDTENPMELDVANDGRVFFVEIGAGALDSFDSAVKMFDPVTDETYVVGEIPVHRRNENGLLGIALDPEFDTNGFIYLYYSVPGPQNEMGTQHLSRFTFDPEAGEVGQLDMASEVVLLEIPHQRRTCCHSAGSLAFGPDGFLYLTTADDTTPFQTDGFGPHDPRECGPGPGSEGCTLTDPEDARHAFDARRTSGNAADLRGKLVRIDPLEAATPEDAPGLGSTYDVDDQNLFTSGEYDDLFPGGTYDPALGRPEIFAMGFRNPFRFTVDEETGWVYLGQVGPDAGNDCFPTSGGSSGQGGLCSENPRGPRGYDTINQIREAANMGWPYCIAGQGYYEFDYATGTSGDQFDCEGGPTNNSPLNTGIDTLPPVTEPLIWYPYGSSPEFPEIPPAGSRAAMGGPVYHFDPELDSEVKLSEYYDGKLIWGDWTRNLLMATTLDENGDYVTSEEFMPNADFRHPHDIELGPDGALYIIEWGNNFNFAAGGINPDSGLYRIEQRRGGLPALAEADASPTSGSPPLEVQFTGELSDRGAADPPTYEWDFGDGETSTEVNPTHTYTDVGVYQVTLTVTDADGVTTDTVTVRAAESSCARSDEFDGDELNGCRWSQIVRENPDNYSVGDGALSIVAGTGDLFGGLTNAENLILQPAPGGEWTVETELSYEATQNYQQAGLIVYGDDTNWTKFGLLWVDGRVLEYVWQENGSPRRDPALDVTPVDAGFPTTLLMRLESDGSDVTAHYSIDDGASWTQVGRTVPIGTIPDPHVGLFAFSGTVGATENVASFDYFRVTPDEQQGDTTPPETDVQLNDADPVPSYDGPVDVALSATDPGGGGGGEPETHQVDAQPATWDPDSVELALGDEIQWNFPASANFNHDVWRIAPDEEPDSAGTEVTDGPVPAGGDPVSATFDQAGAWTFVCKVHSFVSEGAWEGMVGTANVAEGGGEASGVDVTEYSVDGGAPVVAENAGGDDPFLTEFTVSGEGEHVVEYGSVDNAGNEEPTQSVEFEIEGEVGGAPELRLSVKPKRKTVKPGKRARFTATARNIGDAEASKVRVCAKAPKSKAKVVGKACATAAGLDAGARFAPKFTLKPTRKARGKKVKVVFTATGDGLKTIRSTATLKVKR